MQVYCAVGDVQKVGGSSRGVVVGRWARSLENVDVLIFLRTIAGFFFFFLCGGNAQYI